MRLKNNSWLTVPFLLLLMQLCGCAGVLHETAEHSPDSTASQSGKEPMPDQSSPPSPEETAAEWTIPGPRAIASLELTTQAENLLTQRQPDAAIRILERAVQLNPTNGQNYYYLAEAWLMKQNTAQAREFNDLAQIYFAEDKTWLQRAERQRERIEKHRK